MDGGYLIDLIILMTRVLGQRVSVIWNSAESGQLEGL